MSMSPEMVWFLGSQVVLFINVTTMHTALRRKYKLVFSISMFVLFDIVLYTFLIITGETPGATRSITGFTFLPLVIWLYRESLFQKIFAVFLALQFTVGLTSLAGGFADLLTRSESGEYTLIHFSIGFVLLSGYFILILRFGRNVFTKLFEHGRHKEWVMYSLGAVFSYAVMLFVNNRFGGVAQIFLILFILWGFAVLCFAIINTHEKTKISDEAEYSAKIISSGRDHYQKMDELQEKLSILRHDYKYHITAIGEMANSGDNKGIAEYLDSIGEQLSENELRYYCSNNVINALLSTYAERCAKAGIRFDVVVTMPKILTIPNYDLCIILGNLLENATEACEKLGDGRYIEFWFKPLGQQLALMVKNSFNGEITEDRGKIVSVKENGGLGFKSIEAVAARYDGELTTDWDENSFTASVTIKQ